MNKASGWKYGFFLLLICMILQIINIIRYYDRMPNDYIGNILYFATLVFFSISIIGFYLTYKKEKNNII